MLLAANAAELFVVNQLVVFAENVERVVAAQTRLKGLNCSFPVIPSEIAAAPAKSLGAHRNWGPLACEPW
jgi:hypothetical protein